MAPEAFRGLVVNLCCCSKTAWICFLSSVTLGLSFLPVSLQKKTKDKKSGGSNYCFWG